MPPKNIKNVEDKAAIANAQAAYGHACELALDWLYRMSVRADVTGLEIRRVSIRFPTEQHGDSLVTVAAIDGDGRPVVGFTANRYPDDALIAAIKAIDLDIMKWKDDEWYKGSPD